MKIPKKFRLNENLCYFIDNVSEHYDITKSALVEELLLHLLLPERFNVHANLILNDDFAKDQVEKYLREMI